MFRYCWEKWSNQQYLNWLFGLPRFFWWIFLELLYCYMRLENFLQLTFWTATFFLVNIFWVVILLWYEFRTLLTIIFLHFFGGEVKIVKCPQAVCKLFVRYLCGDVINLCLRSIVPCRKCSKKCKTKINKCNHPIPEAHNSWQKVLKKEGRDEIKKCNHPTLEVLDSLQKMLKKEGGDKIKSCNHPTPEVLNSLQKLLKKKVKMR